MKSCGRKLKRLNSGNNRVAVRKQVKTVPILLFKLTNVPEDEAQEVRQLLSDNNIDAYETSAGRWQTGVAAIWLKDEQQHEQARALLDEYQEQRARQARQRFDEMKAGNELEGIAQSIVRQPLRWLIIGIAVAVVVGLMVVPFVGFLS